MTFNPVSSQSSGYGSPTLCKGRIEAIDDPNKRNRVQVRIFGLQDNQGNIPKDQLEWIHCLAHDSQIAGATSTHNYFPGAEVLIMDTGTEKFVMGAHSGFDSETKLQSNPYGQDQSQPQNSDVPNVNRQQPSDTTTRTGSGALVGPPQNQAGANNYFQYGNWQSNIIQKAYQYATGKGQKPAPWGQGQVSKFDTLKSIGLQQNQQGSDVLNLIQSLDGNQSGSIQAAIQIILNLRNNGFTNAMGVIGAGTFNQALNQYATQFGSTTQNDLINIVTQLLTYITLDGTFQGQNFYTNVMNGNINNIITFLGNQLLGVASDTLAGMADINANVATSANNAPLSYYNAQLNQFNLLFQTAVAQAMTSILAQLNSIYQAAGNDLPTFVLMFGGTVQLTQFCQALLAIANYIGMPQVALATIAGNVIALGLANSLPQIIPSFTNQPTNPTNSSGSAANMLIGLLAMFKGNPIGTAETLGGGLIKTFLSKNPIKYQQADRNDGQSVLKLIPKTPSGSRAMKLASSWGG